MMFPDSETIAKQQAPLRTLRAIDSAIRADHRLVPWRSATVPAETFSFARFRDDRMTLTIYRNERAPSGR